jgi:uncharacterized membrane protein
MLVPFSAFAETIDSFATTVHILADGSAEVTETILYDFGRENRHGIYRNIPVEYRDSDGKRNVFTIDSIAVTDGAGTPYDFSTVTEGGDTRIKIGNEKILINGKKTYEITYVAHDVVGFFDDYDELYWNATGNEWQFPIVESSARVYAPASTTRSACYIGVLGSAEPCASTEVISADGSALFFETGRVLVRDEGLTVAVAFPKGFVTEPRKPSAIAGAINTFWPFIIPLLICGVLYSLWNRFGRDETGRGTIIPEYDIPKGISPALMSEILKQRVTKDTISALIVQLAIRGYLRIHREEHATLGVFSSVSYRFERQRPADADLSFEENAVFEALFLNRESVTSDELKKEGKLIKTHAEISKSIDTQSVRDGYYRIKPAQIKGGFMVAGIGIVILSFFLAVPVSFTAMLAGVLTGILVAVFGFFMPALTKAGALVREQILGLKDYLQIAEKNRLDFHNAPERTTDLFEKLLPYAMVLGVSLAWAKEFEGLYKEPPRWYDGGSYAAFTPVAFAGDMNAMAKEVSTLATPTSNGGGSGGGGFSGGGFGGGGGGSW